MTKLPSDDSILQSIKGWAAMTPEKREWLRGKYHRGQQAASAEQLAAVDGAIVLLEVDQGLVGEKMKITNYIDVAYPASPRASFSRLKQMRKLSKKLPMPYIRALAERGANLLPSAAVPLGELVSAVERIPAKRLPALPSPEEPEEQPDPKTIDAFIATEIPPALKKGRQERQQVAKVKLDDEAYTRMFFRSMDLTIRNAQEDGLLTSSSEVRSVIKTGVGWLMKRNSLGGTIQVKATDIPEGIIAQVGRPATDEEAEEAG